MANSALLPRTRDMLILRTLSDGTASWPWHCGDGDDVRMIERGDGAGFTPESLEAVWIGGNVGRQHLERHVTAEARIVRPVHVAHAARTERSHDLVNSSVGSTDTAGSDRSLAPGEKPRPNDVQTGTAAAAPCRYTQNMQTNFVKAALMGAWVLAVGAFGYMSGAASFAVWTLLAVVSLAPPMLMRRLWSAPPQTMSETIRKVLR
jgi:hypothetical protein